MGWMQSIFSGGKEKEHVTKLAQIAQAQNAFDPEELQILMREMNYTPAVKTASQPDLEKYRMKLPQEAREKFSVVFYLVNKLMMNGALSDKKEVLIQKMILGLELSREKAIELVSFLKMNIRNGLSEEDSFNRLGYLLERAKYA
ncbi:MAG: hypothetical protein CMP48_27990 [Rickettsiales bacterium]|nr:hypothetical protein [Rickettsiales bacterium]